MNRSATARRQCRAASSAWFHHHRCFPANELGDSMSSPKTIDARASPRHRCSVRAIDASISTDSWKRCLGVHCLGFSASIQPRENVNLHFDVAVNIRDMMKQPGATHSCRHGTIDNSALSDYAFHKERGGQNKQMDMGLSILFI
jgi:hypothetical protein